MAEEKPAKKARKEFSASFDFSSAEAIDPALCWNHPRESASLEGGAGLRVTPKPGTDYWRKTFRDPPADRASGHALLYNVPSDAQQCTILTEFSLKEHVQFDQAGLIVYLDDSHWLKTGLEFENGVSNMSCVVTNGQSDWNYLVWPTSQNVKLRLTLQLYPGVCECKVEHWDERGEGEEGKWTFLREAPIMGGPDGVKVGPMCCAPKKMNENEGMEAIFKYFSVQGE